MTRSARVAALVVVAMLAVRPAAAADSPATTVEDRPPGQAVTLGRDTLFHIHTSRQAWTVAQRAGAITRRLEALVRDRHFAPESLSVSEDDNSSDIVAGEYSVTSVWDAETLGTGMTRPDLARNRAEIMRVAMIRFREERSARNLALAGLWALLATAGLAVALSLLRRLRAALGKLLRGWLEDRRDTIQKKSFALLDVERIAEFLARGGGILGTFLALGLVFLYVSLVLGFFPATRHLSARLATLVLQPFQTLVDGFIEHLPGLIFLAVLWWVTDQLLRLIQFLFQEIEAERIKISRFYPEWAMPTFKLFRVLAIGLAVIVGYPYIPGSDTDAFKGVSIFFGVLVSLGSSSVVSNVIAGIVLTYMRSFRLGDVVQIGDHIGRVVETTMFVTRINTVKNVEINLPNSVVLGSNVVNYSAKADETGLILHTEITIGYTWPWRQVHALLLRAADRTDGLLKDPKPYVIQRSLGEFGVQYQINAYTHSAWEMFRIYSRLNKNIQDEFNEFGVEIMLPAYEGDRPTPTLSPKERWYAAPARQPGEPGADE